MACSSEKRKRKVLTIDEKLEIISLLDENHSLAAIASKYGIGRSTVSDIKRDRQKLLDFKKQTLDMGMYRCPKTMRLGTSTILDKAVYLWFKQKRMDGIPISGPILCEKAIQLSKKLFGEGYKFVASEGWKWRFCDRHGIRSISSQGEKLAADTDAAVDFVPRFRAVIESRNISLDQIFNCDETGLNFRLLPEKTLAASFERSVDGRKKSKERVTLNVCSNASGTIKLPIHLIGKAKKPRCFKGINMELLPVVYSAQKNAWMEGSIFYEWFHNNFVPYVQERLGDCEAVLLLDNCAAHPDVEELVSENGKIAAKFLPPNVTSLIQPMDQGVLVTLKRIYKKKLLSRLISADEGCVSIVDFLKSVNMKVVIDLIKEAWDEIKDKTLRKSWEKILPLDNEDEVLQMIDFDQDTESNEVAEMLGMLNIIRIPAQETGTETQLSEEDVFNWLNSDSNDPGFKVYSDDEICEVVTQESSGNNEANEDDEDEDDEVEEMCPITHGAAADMFDKCLQWLQHQPEASLYNVTTIRELRSLAITKRQQSMKQSSITDYFPTQ